MTAPRYLEKFTSYDGSSTVLTFPLETYEWSGDQPIRNAYRNVIGAHFAYDFHGTGIAPRGIANESIRTSIVKTTSALLEAEFDTLRAKVANIGLGRLYLLDTTGARRWAYARATVIPQSTLGILNTTMAPITLEFERHTDWQGETANTGSQAIVSTPHTHTVANNGNIAQRRVILRIKAASASGFVDVSILNVTNNYRINTGLSSLSADSEILIDTKRNAVEFSNDNGVTYTNAFGGVSLAATQVGLMQLEPGNNDLRVYGVTDGSLEWDFNHAYI